MQQKELLKQDQEILGKDFEMIYLPFCKKYLLKYQGRALAVGYTPAQAIAEGVQVYKTLRLWSRACKAV